MKVRSDGHPVTIVPNADYFAKLHWKLSKDRRLPLWVIYGPTTKEYPGSWVARMHVSLPEEKATRFVMTHDSLEELRTLIPSGLVRLGRDPSDPAEIVEMWI